MRQDKQTFTLVDPWRIETVGTKPHLQYYLKNPDTGQSFGPWTLLSEVTRFLIGTPYLTKEGNGKEPSPYANRADIMRQSDPMRIGKHEWRLTFYRGLLRQHYVGCEWRPIPRPPYPASSWARAEDWPRYDHNSGFIGGLPKTLRKLFDKCPWACPYHYPFTGEKRQ